MPSIIVSADVPDTGHAIGEKVAQALGYGFVGRELLEEVAERHAVDKKRLWRALTPSSYRKLAKRERDLLLSYVESATLQELTKDSMVCTDLAAHLYARDISHILMIHILSESQTGLRGIKPANDASQRRATKTRLQEKALRSRWSTECFSVDETDPSNYDMVLSLGQIEIDKLVDVMRDMAGYRKFQSMSYSQKCLNDLSLAAAVRTALLPNHPEIRVRANGETVVVHVKCSRWKKQNVVASIKEIVGQFDVVGLVEVHAATKIP
ncbi:AAA family ATPase [Myxococcota bacterium]